MLLKERNHLLTMRDWARAQRANIPNPQRIIKVQAACESHPALVHVCARVRALRDPTRQIHPLPPCVTVLYRKLVIVFQSFVYVMRVFVLTFRPLACQ